VSPKEQARVSIHKGFNSGSTPLCSIYQAALLHTHSDRENRKIVSSLDARPTNQVEEEAGGGKGVKWQLHLPEHGGGQAGAVKVCRVFVAAACAADRTASACCGV
jgi:hypothetical protein